MKWYEPVARAILDAGVGFMGHGAIQGAPHLLSDQLAATISESIQLLRDFTGKKPRGWLCPSLSETWETLDLLAEEGVEYASDWVNDDQPYEIRTSVGPLVSVPYTLELNDIPMMVIQHHTSTEWSSARETSLTVFTRRARRTRGSWRWPSIPTSRAHHVG